MPFKSTSQRKWMYANKPKMAKEFASKTPKGKKLPKKVKAKGKLGKLKTLGKLKSTRRGSS